MSTIWERLFGTAKQVEREAVTQATEAGCTRQWPDEVGKRWLGTRVYSMQPASEDTEGPQKDAAQCAVAQEPSIEDLRKDFAKFVNAEEAGLEKPKHPFRIEWVATEAAYRVEKWVARGVQAWPERRALSPQGSWLTDELWDERERKFYTRSMAWECCRARIEWYPLRFVLKAGSPAVELFPSVEEARQALWNFLHPTTLVAELDAEGQIVEGTAGEVILEDAGLGEGFWWTCP